MRGEQGNRGQTERESEDMLRFVRFLMVDLRGEGVKGGHEEEGELLVEIEDQSLGSPLTPLYVLQEKSPARCSHDVIYISGGVL